MLEIVGYALIIIGTALGIFSWAAFDVFMFVALGFGLLLSVTALLLEEIPSAAAASRRGGDAHESRRWRYGASPLKLQDDCRSGRADHPCEQKTTASVFLVFWRCEPQLYGNPERAPRARLTGHPHVTSHQLGEAPGDSQA